MKRNTILFSIFFFIFAISASPALAFLNNWYIDPTGAGGATDKVLIGEILDTVGTTWIDNTIDPTTNTGTFEEWGSFESSGHDGLGSSIGYTDINGVKYTGELTALFYATGVVDLNAGTIGFADGYLDVYVDFGVDYGTNTDGAADFRTNPETYGANNGTRIGSFDVLPGGGGLVDVEGNVGAPNGQISTNMVATYIDPGYWYMPDGVTDFSTLQVNWILGYGTSNASYIPPNIAAGVYATAINELVTEFAGGTYVGLPPDDFIISGNGQFRVDVVPEPGTMLLLGFGLLGIAGVSRKKYFK